MSLEDVSRKRKSPRSCNTIVAFITGNWWTRLPAIDFSIYLLPFRNQQLRGFRKTRQLRGVDMELWSIRMGSSYHSQWEITPRMLDLNLLGCFYVQYSLRVVSHVTFRIVPWMLHYSTVQIATIYDVPLTF